MQMRKECVFRKENTQDVWQKRTNCDSGVMVSIVAFQAVDRGSIPRWRSNFLVIGYILRLKW